MSLVKNSKIGIDICVATYKRPALLEKLLDSIFNQETKQAFTYNLIVVDNDEKGSAIKIVNKFREKGYDILYDIEPIKNIALSRNRAITLGTDELIATVDDDEVVDKEWLWHLFSTQKKYDADVVFGSVAPAYEAPPPAYIQKSRVFELPSPATGSISGFVYNTSSSLFRRAILKNIPGPFDQRFGLTGGSDSYFFNQVNRLGGKLVWSKESLVHHLIPANRASLYWVFKREFRYGNTHYSIWGKGPFFINLPRWLEFLVGVLCIPLFLVLTAAAALASLLIPNMIPKAIWWFRRLGFYTGLTSSFFSYTFKEYSKG